jgi:hypothetical protein
MSLFDKPLVQCSEADLLALIPGELEGKTLDYKRDPVGKTESEKKEFFYDVSSFANALGGHLIFGMDEKNAAATKLLGLSGINVDDETLRLEQMIRDGVRPPILGVQTTSVALASRNAVLVIRIPKSWNPPHQVTYQKAFRFYGRDSNGKYQLDVDELRSIFALSATASERLKLFRIDRVAKIVAGDSPVPLSTGGKTVTHILPLSAFTSAHAVNLNSASHAMLTLGGSGSLSFNLEGVLVSSYHSLRSRYAQFFRDGCIEIVDRFSDEADKRAQLPATAFENQIIEKLSSAMRLLHQLEIAPPIIIMITLLAMKGWGIATQWHTGSGTFDRDPIFLPELALESLNGNLADALKPLFDVVWNAAGLAGSPNYDNLGQRRHYGA